MSKLAADAAAFKATLHRQNYSCHSPPAPTTPTESTTPNTPETFTPPRKKRPKLSVVYSQIADIGTVTLIPHPSLHITLCASRANTPIDTDTFREKFRSHDRVQYDPKADIHSYKHEFSFRNKAALLTEIQRQTRKGGGISVRALKESWKEAPQAIEELEKEGEVLVTRTVKDGQLRMVFWNEIKPDEEGGGKLVEKEFNELWHSLKVPNDVDLLKQLANEGLQVTNAETLVPKAPGTKKKGKKGGAPRQRQVRITNTHLKGEIDLSKDFIVPGKP
ncbi:transcription initiation factor IIE, beta subunit [Macrolepiota fuliginosa MF-IS2]|uniref:Transcription initiation factor IIE subunit beta n=1 Tax=Macrolepiota fuliginosa MF-IS2 TaxID=1400762 RepID=A0A9P5XIV2_9AGAR|nr:transcription initiation factor IIE, beta subunit [Macrolepiota fuliginosa MF-IS2]